MSGWGSWLKTDASATDAQPNFTAVSDRPQDALYGPLEAKDLEWTCASGFATETSTFYTVLEDGAFATSQVIHSAVGLWYPQVQITFKYFNPKTGDKVWKSTKVTNFVTPPPAGSGRDKSKTYDKRSAKGDQFTLLFDTHADGSESYTIDANMDDELQLSYTYTRPANAPGWKLGTGADGGKSYFGASREAPDGYMYHRFWPRATSAGHIIYKGQAIDAKGVAMHVHAIQGMRPNLTASRWNFANFQSNASSAGPQVSAIMMEFTTTSDYGGPVGSRTKKDEATGNVVNKRDPIVVTIGSVSVDGELVSVNAATRGLVDTTAKGSKTGVVHNNLAKDAETSYAFPQSIDFVWQGPLLSGGKAQADQQVNAELSADLSKGLVDKVDVLGEIPYVVRKMVNYVAGTKPFIYQHLNPATIKVKQPSKEEATVNGVLYSEVTFISEP